MTSNPSPLRGATVLAAAGAAAFALKSRPSAGSFDTTDLSGRTAVVTGAGSGIGRSLAVLLAARGAHVHVVDLDAAAADAVAGQLRQAGGSAVAHHVDVTDAAAVEALAASVQAAGPVDLLFNNAGIGHAGAVVDTPLEDWRRLLDVNVLGVVHGVSAFLPAMLERGGPACIVNTASLAGLVPTPGLVPYSTTKAAVVGLSDALDLELSGSGVRVLALCPGIIDTPIVRTATMRGDWARRQAGAVASYAKRGTSPDVVAAQALAGVATGRPVIPSPRAQVVPAWLVKRAWPRASRGLSRATVRLIARR